MNILVTGGAGFIGSHLVERLLALGEEVFVLDDLSTGRKENLQAVWDSPRLHFVEGDVRDESVCGKLIAECEQVYHLAAAVGVKLIVSSPIRTIESIVHGTEVVLREANRDGKKVLITSSSEVYGKSTKSPFKEDDDILLGPTTKSRWCYACSKALDEFLALFYKQEHGLPTVIVRLFNTVGPRQVGTYGMVMPRFVRQALDGDPITVYDDGQQTRCFVYVGDAVDAMIKLMHTESAMGQIFNLGNDQAITIMELAEKVRAAINPDIEIVSIPYEEAYKTGYEDIRHRVPDISKISAAIGFHPSLYIDQIIESVIEYCKANKE